MAPWEDVGSYFAIVEEVNSPNRKVMDSSDLRLALDSRFRRNECACERT
jgi:hypothetical protein